MSIFKIFAVIGNIAAKTTHVTDEVAKLEGTDFSKLSKVETVIALAPALNKLIDLAEIATGDEGDKKLEEIRAIINSLND